MSLMEEVKTANRITTDDAGIQLELQGLIEAAKVDLLITGVSELKANDESDPMVRRAIILYTKTHFGYDNPDADRLQATYQKLIDKLAMDIDYSPEAVV